ncbi:FAD-binding domain-containing protein [Aspergillus avenaceus]|uniref:FAD-binding domain-containing protein n=1 Tax=Aspergillus avenaceus TaxID=36643 RepID=A0A5N6U100_ASPAV|nr:FAD-binding domain-containing protein [Aspergillus avenaceus]
MALTKSSVALLAFHTLSVFAGDSCTIDSFNATLDGRVQPLKPLSLPCFSSYNGNSRAPDQSACNAIQRDYSDAFLRANSANGFMYNQIEECASDPRNQCLLDYTNPFNTQALESCHQGNVPSFSLEIKKAEDAMEAFKFSRCSGTPLSIKSSGHDLLGRSSGRGSLNLWTRNLRSLQYTPNFIPAGCDAGASSEYRAVTVGGGVNLDEAYRFAHDHNVTFVGGYAPTVSVGGGWAQAGGHSILSPVYGLGIDRALEYKVITPDGQYRIANECQHQDLFWALRGGGGGTFGLVLESTHKVEPRVSFVSAVVEFPLQSDSRNVLPFLDILVNNSVKWAHEGWGGHFRANSLINITPLLSLSEAKDSLAELAAYVRSQGGTVAIEEFADWLGFYERYVIPNAVEIGDTHFPNTRLVPKAVFETAEGRKNLMDFFARQVSQGGVVYVQEEGPLLYRDVKPTSATPAWREAVWAVTADGFWAWNSTLEERKQSVSQMNEMTELMEAITPGSGTYGAEGNPFTKNWQEAWWGRENYDQLLEIKAKYDPDRLLNCWKCVGWEESEAQDSCFASFE